MIHLNILLTETEHDQLLAAATANGFETPSAYLKWLAFTSEQAQILDDIRESLLSIKRGDQMLTLDEMWAEVERESGL